MNCPNCGAENDADAHFCAECGTPLENQDIEATIAGQNLRDADNDATVFAGPDAIAVEDEKTVSVDQAMLANALANEAASASQPETSPPSAPPADSTGGAGAGGASPGDDAGDNNNRKMWIIVGVITLLILCCCCIFSIALGSILRSYPGIFENINDLSSLPAYLPLV